MKKRHATAAALTLTALAFGLPQIGAKTYEANNPSVDFAIIVTHEPMFPLQLKNEGYSNGEVVIAFEVDYLGELRDWIPVKATHPLFIDSVSQVIEKWDFTPPFIDGENRSIVSRLAVEFKSSGSVLSLDMASDMTVLRLNALTGYSNDAEKLADVEKLDTPPSPLHVVRPAIPREVIQEHNGSSAVFTFYVDKAGNVRVPALDYTNGNVEPAMLLAAQDALEQWTFQPPRVNSKPVNIKLSQRFVFTDR